MSAVLLRAALETALNGMSPALITAWENQTFNSQPSSTAYQQPFLIPAEPENPEMGDTVHRERGIFQVSLFYPPQTGSKDAAARAELIRALFHRGASFSSGGVTVIIGRTPHIGKGSIDGDHWFVPVKIRYFANIT